jgi:hypothetical protein
MGSTIVLYEKTSLAKDILPKKEWWRIVNFNLKNEESIIDWTHEREWRAPNDFKFILSEATILVTNKNMYRKLLIKCEEHNIDILKKVKGIVVMSSILF